MAPGRLRTGWARPGYDPQACRGRSERRRRAPCAVMAAARVRLVYIPHVQTVGDRIEIACSMCVMASVPECSYVFYDSIAWF